VHADKSQLPQIAGYTTESVLGAGGMATVYLAVQESLSRHVALKVMNQILMADADFCRRFLNEGRLIAKLSHPNIVTVYDIGASDRFHYLSMTYLSGGTLRETIRRGLPLDYAVYILKCLADALGYAHRQGIIHRDIKPSNVLFTHSGAPVLTDFGIAKTVGTETKLTSTGMAVGSVGYMSPEQALGNPVDSRSDLYSLGVLFWQMLTGSLPYSAPDPFALALKHAHDPIPELPEPLGRFQPVVVRLMAKRPEDRFASAEELLRVIDAVPYGDIGAQSPPNADHTVVLSRVRESTPHRRSIPPGPQANPSPAPERRLGPAIAAIGIAGLAAVGAMIYYSGLLTPDAGMPDASPPVLPTKPRVPASGALPGAPDQSGARAVQTPPPPVPDKQTAQPGPGVGAEPTPSVKSALPRAPTSPQVQGQPSIEALLRQAERQLKAGRLTEPPGDNAFESYNRVLDLDPENLQAEEELVKIGRINAASRVFSAADALLRQGAIDEARRMIDTGLRMNPDDERLLGLRRALD
jgi:serine/threonine protein kinase